MLNLPSTRSSRHQRFPSRSPAGKAHQLQARLGLVVALCFGFFLLQSHPCAAEDDNAPQWNTSTAPVDRQISPLLHRLETQIIAGRVLAPADDNAVDTWVRVLTEIAATPDRPGLKQALADLVESMRADAKDAQAADKIETATYLLTFAELANNLAQRGLNPVLGQPDPNSTRAPPDLPRLDEPQQKLPDQDLALGAAPPSSSRSGEDTVPSGPQAVPADPDSSLPGDMPRQGLIQEPAAPAPAAQALAGLNAIVGRAPHDAPVVPPAPPAAAPTPVAPTAMAPPAAAASPMASTAMAPPAAAPAATAPPPATLPPMAPNATVPTSMAPSAAAPTPMASTATAALMMAMPADPLPNHAAPAAPARAALPGSPPANAGLADAAASPTVTRAPAPSTAPGALPTGKPSAGIAALPPASSPPAGSSQPSAPSAQAATALPAAAASALSPPTDGATQAATAASISGIPSPSSDTLDDRAARLALETHDGAAAAALIGKLVRSEAFQPAADTALLARGDAMMRNKDIAAARNLYQSAANGGSARAALSLAQSYDPAFTATSAEGAKPDTGRAINWYRRAADLGAAGAQTRLQALITKTAR